MSYRIEAGGLSDITLNETDTVKSILQNIKIILATRRGSVPLYREFGLSHEMVDRPINVAKALLVSEIREAVETFEPRAEVVGVSFETPEPGVLVPTVEVNVIGT